VFLEGTEDVIYFKRKSSLSVEDEFLMDYKSQIDLERVVKRRRLL
jgi:hypothetical protein